ncbi:MAG: hypothetical protein EO766_11750 [Hydrotalea sp. AMD]|uniref:hypothetical protein n=1 Tax=Hydrotalea sp. AMD TaxID=2501297 RepID=UPI00102547C4|nr:hypothetical protein [Hydrotalea sp. AMD]RWZ87198.1 MAG: hypothetical protein EO766_11750 [Hydrotalea sp. AMD]
MTYIKSTGRIIYDPNRPGMKKRNTGWCIISVDTEITRYYRWWLEYQYHIHLQPPSWDAHISVVRGEFLSDAVKSLWKKYHKQPIEFEYEHGNIQKHRSGREQDGIVPGDYYVIDVKCPTIDMIRQELGLKTGYKYHLTVGRSYEYVSRYENRKDRRHQSGK